MGIWLFPNPIQSNYYPNFIIAREKPLLDQPGDLEDRMIVLLFRVVDHLNKFRMMVSKSLMFPVIPLLLPKMIIPTPNHCQIPHQIIQNKTPKAMINQILRILKITIPIPLKKYFLGIGVETFPMSIYEYNQFLCDNILFNIYPLHCI